MKQFLDDRSDKWQQIGIIPSNDKTAKREEVPFRSRIKTLYNLLTPRFPQSSVQKERETRTKENGEQKDGGKKKKDGGTKNNREQTPSLMASAFCQHAIDVTSLQRALYGRRFH